MEKDKISKKINGYYTSVYLGEIGTMRDKDFKEIWKNKNGDIKFLEEKMYKLKRQNRA